jgi:hypothetical protein
LEQWRDVGQFAVRGFQFFDGGAQRCFGLGDALAD